MVRRTEGIFIRKREGILEGILKGCQVAKRKKKELSKSSHTCRYRILQIKNISTRKAWREIKIAEGGFTHIYVYIMVCLVQKVITYKTAGNHSFPPSSACRLSELITKCPEGELI